MEHVFFTMDMDVVRQKNRLQSISKNAYPYAIKETLNQAAFDTRRGIILRAKAKYHIRTGAKAKGGIFNMITPVKKTKFNRNVAAQVAYAGIKPYRPKTDIPAKRMRAQEFGGSLENTKVALSDARVSKTMDKRVKRGTIKGKQYKNISQKDLKSSKFVEKVSLRSGGKWSTAKQLAVAAYWAARNDKLVRYKGNKGQWLYSAVKYRNGFAKKGKGRFEFTKLFSMKDGRAKNMKGNRIVGSAAHSAAKDMRMTFNDQFRKRLAKIK